MKQLRVLIFAATTIALFIVVNSAAYGATGTWPDLRGPTNDGAVRDGRLFAGGNGDLTITWQRELGAGYPVVTVDDKRVWTAALQLVTFPKKGLYLAPEIRYVGLRRKESPASVSLLLGLGGTLDF